MDSPRIPGSEEFVESTFAVIGGSGAYDLLRRSVISGENLGSIDTPFGQSQPIFRVKGDFGSFLFLSRHGVERYSIAAPFVNYRANIYALKHLGVNSIVAWSGPGTISTEYVVAQFVLVDDVIDETRGRESSFFNGTGLGFIRQNPVFCPSLRNVMAEALKELNYDFADKGTYVCTQGPRLETPAEIRKFASFGGNLVGMTLCPEVFLARELEMCYAAVCYVSNYAEGVVERDYRHGELFEGMLTRDEMEKVQEAVARMPGLLQEIARRLREKPLECTCRQAMERYRRRGDIGHDWREWFKK